MRDHGAPIHPTGPVTPTSIDDGTPVPPAPAGQPETDEALPPVEKKSLGRRLLGVAVSLGMVVAIFAFLVPKLDSGADLSSALALITPFDVAVVLVLGLINLASNWPPMMTALPGLRFPQAGVANLTSSALSNTVPEGGAIATGLTFGIFHSWGFRVQAITLSLLTTGVWTNLVRYSLLALGLLALEVTSSTTAPTLTGAVIVAGAVAAAVVLFVLVLRSEGLAHRVGHRADAMVAPFARRLHKDPPELEAKLLETRVELLGLVSDRWMRLTVTMTISQLTAILILWASLRLMGIGADEVSLSLVVVAYGGASLVALVSPTPGGMGVVEAALLAILSPSVPPDQQNALLAAVVLYRAATWLLPIPLGAGTYLVWRYKRSWRRPVASAPRDAGPSGTMGGMPTAPTSAS